METVAHPCFGIPALGLCAYDPARPFSAYFTLGEVVGALIFTLAVHQLLKPIYRFRLAAYHFPPTRLYLCVFLGVITVLFAAIVPSLPWLPGPLGYAINWEIVGAILFIVPYAAVVLAIVRPVRVSSSRIVEFARGAANLLSSADEQDHIDFANDLERSLPELIKAALFTDHLEDISAFFEFLHRKELDRASYASALLRIVADPAFCQTLVRRSPWRIVHMLQDISTNRLHAQDAEQFIRELAHQAILRDDGMMAREVGYHGFGTAPLLSDSLFADQVIIQQYNPFDFTFVTSTDAITPSIVKRFNSAAERCYSTLIETGTIYHSRAAFSIHRFYQGVFMGASKIQKAEEYDYRLPLEMHYGVEIAIKMADKLAPARYRALYVTTSSEFRHDILETLIEIVYDALAAISNRFKGADDPFWFLAIGAFRDAFPSIGEQPDGMTPFQQRLALKIIRELNHNMQGRYPAICRVLLACVGPYEQPAAQPNRTAFNFLRDATYYELQQGLPRLAASHPEKISDYLPDNVAYDAATNTLTHTYGSGRQAVTTLAALNLRPINLLDEGIRRQQ